MNSEETLALYAQGKEAWNVWAKDMLARRDGSQEWEHEATAFFSSQLRERFIEVHKKNIREVDFSGFIFPGRAGFSFFSFDHIVIFDHVKFEGWADFTNVQFLDQVTFRDAVFMAIANFPLAKFRGLTIFTDAIFKGSARFNNAAFHENTASPKSTNSGSVFSQVEL